MSGSTLHIPELEAALAIRTTRDEANTLDLRYGVYSPDGAVPKRYVAFLNGRTEWIEKYAYVGRDLALPQGTGFLTWDHRGQGGSGGARSYVSDYEAYSRDAAKIVAEVCGDKPYVLLAHSMGGLIALHATLTGRLKPRAMALASPLLGLPDEPVPRLIARPLARLLSRARLGVLSSGGGKFTSTPFERNRLTHSVELYRRMQATPYRCSGATFGWVSATFDAIDLCFDPARLKTLTAPTLVLGGSEESIVDPSAFRSWVATAAAAAAGPVQLRIVPGARHELLSEIPQYYEPALRFIRDWLAPHLGPG